jgi:Transglycosylase-like domain/Putative Flp pilus-assembly TadE/G-like
MNARAGVRGEDGQIIPPLLVILLLCLLFGFMMLQVGLAADYKSRSQTAADAAALAGAIEVKREILAAYAMDHQLQPEEIQMGLVCAQAAIYAARNRAAITDCQHDQYDIKVKVRGNDELQGVGDTQELSGDHAEAKARATPWSFGSGGGILGAGGGSLPVGGGGGGPLMGANPRLQPYVDVAAKFGLHVSSGLRPNSITTNGNHSLHETGFAVDLAGSPEDMLRFAKYAVEHWGGQLEELIHTPLGYGVKNGQQVPLAFWGSATNADHFDHVHLADTNPPAKADLDGGPPQGGSGGGGGGGDGGGGLGGGSFGGGGLGGFGLEVHLVRWDGQGGRVPDIPGAPDDFPENLRQIFYNIMMCESGGNPRIIEQPGGNGGPLGHYGLFQFDIPTWESVGGHGNPIDASPEEQWMRAYLLYRQRGFQPWECADATHLGYA